MCSAIIGQIASQPHLIHNFFIQFNLLQLTDELYACVCRV